MKLKALVVPALVFSATCAADIEAGNGNGIVRNAAFQQCLVNSGQIDRAESKNYNDVAEAIDECGDEAYLIMLSSCGDSAKQKGCTIDQAKEIVSAMNYIKAAQ